VLATFIAATVPVEKAGDVSPLLEAAKQIGEKDDDKTAADNTPGENGVGSYERFMSSFGSPARWAGR
jgi:hypothetical protein